MGRAIAVSIGNCLVGVYTSGQNSTVLPTTAVFWWREESMMVQTSGVPVFGYDSPVAGFCSTPSVD
jgi:hypothetical protein